MSRTLPRPIRGRGRSLASMGLIARLLKAQRRAWWRRQAAEGTSLRQLNEFVFVGHLRETAALPFLLGLLDPFLAGGDEIPPDVARSLEGIAAQKHHARCFSCLHRDAIAGTKDQQAR